ncbi:putative TonB dependent receptor outer membrane protein [Pedobacter sp. BAL39]|uniref:SusC/RagA family TonB-linked outer membrane protein n=1 Tax=Pedobacter sp. BAL39 TaxID=391596 RepID=UPI000155A4B9|nr:TonB-dependent receptor [Pedobacter sp. BAL39]EDM34332.1 putative TonB dependent receptor outer membrane protein [Pedobacter sp. BAL39]
MKRPLHSLGGATGFKWLPLKAFLFCLPLFFISAESFAQATAISGTVSDDKGTTLIGVSVKVKNTKTGTLTDAQGKFKLSVENKNATLVFLYVGYVTQEVPLNGQTSVTVKLKEDNQNLEEIVVTGYGSQKRESITGSIATVTAKDIGRVHGGATVSTSLAGKLPGVTFRQTDGRPGSSAAIQIRNMGRPLYVIDGIQQDEGQFNNLAPNDIESISILKDASAAIYGVRAANGVVVVTTKKGAGDSQINVDAYYGAQNWSRFPDVVRTSYDYMRYRADAEVNSFGSTSITQAELDKYQAGTDPAYRSFDWRDYVLKSNNNAPQNSVNVNFTGGAEKVNYYVSATNLYQNSVIGKEYEFNRSNIQSNITATVAKGLKVGLNINGRIESRENPGVPGGDDYFLARFAVLRNTPLERPYANDNPAYLNTITNNESNYAFLNKALSGTYRNDWRVLQTNFNAEYQIPGVKGLTAKAVYSYYLADYVLNNHEFTYDTYTYRPETDIYERTGGSNNPYREREQKKEFATTGQFQLNYNNTFGKHSLGATLVAERIELKHLRNYIHSSPVSNNLPLIYFPTADRYDDSDDIETRIGYIGRINYNYANKYYLEASARRDASYLFAPDKRVGYFPGVSAGWRITEEQFMKNLLGESKILNELKFRASYGILGDDRNPNDPNQPIVTPYAYLPGYNYNQGTVILDDNAIIVSRDKGVPFDRISWLKSRTFNIGADFGLLDNKLTGSVEYFYRKRTGLLGERNDLIIPQELGYALPQENVNSDAQYGQELSLAYNNKVGELSYNVGGNVSFTRSKSLNTYNPIFFNSWDQYRNSIENRYSNIDWGYEVEGQFTSIDQINNYAVNIDGQGNRTLLPGDLIYKDQNGDGKIDQYDERPIGFGYGRQPNINFGFTIGAAYKAFDFHADFSGGAGYTWFQNYEMRWAFQNNGNLNSIFEDRWHRENMYDVNSAWIPGKYPANRVNPGTSHSDYANNSDFWLHSVKYLRARTIEFGYTLPASVLEKIKIKRARFYLNAYNLFSFDNLKEFNLDPEVADDNGLQFPQNKIVNLGLNLTF